MDLGTDAELLGHWRTMVRACRGLLDSVEDAEDCASKALLQALAVPGLPPANPEAFLVRVAKRRAADELRTKVRGRRRAISLAAHSDAHVVDIAENIVDRAEARWLDDLSRSLPDDTQAVLRTLAEGATPAETAVQLGMTKRAVESHLLRARRALKATWRQTLAIVGLLWAARPSLRPAPLVTAAAAAALVVPLAPWHSDAARVDPFARAELQAQRVAVAEVTPAVATRATTARATAVTTAHRSRAVRVTPPGQARVIAKVDSPAGTVVRASREEHGRDGSVVEDTVACVQNLTVTARRIGC